MIYRKCKVIIFSLAILLFGHILGSAAHAQSSSMIQYDPSRVAWTDLVFQAKNFWVVVSTRIQFTSLPAAEIEALLLPSPQGAPIKPTTPQLYQMTINTTIDPKFRSPVSIFNRIWFNPSDAVALGRIRLRRGEDDFKKIYRFTNQGVFRHQIEPKDSKEALLTPENWTKRNDSFYTYDPAQLGCPSVTERSLLIYILSATDISKIGNPISMCVFGKRQLHQVQFKQEGIVPLSVDFSEKTQQTKIRKNERIDSIKITIIAEPTESDLDEVENFSFLGLHKDIAVYIDPASHIPVQVRGIIPGVGEVNLKLREVWLKN